MGNAVKIGEMYPFGTSMKPYISNKGEKIVLDKITDNLKKYDVILYRRNNGTFVLHRIVGKNENGYILCGDNQVVCEFGITDDMVVAILTGLMKDGKFRPCSGIRYWLYCRFWNYTRRIRRLYRKIKRKLTYVRSKKTDITVPTKVFSKKSKKDEKSS